MSNNAHDLSNRLLKALDDNYNVVDMRTVNEIISILEKINITKELLETTRLGKHVNELRRKTSDQTLARRAKVLVKRWRDLVIPNVASPAHTGSNRSSAERQVRRLGGTPLTSPALSRQVVSPAVPSPRPPSRPAWGGYESDSQDVILVDEEPPSAPAAPAPAAPPPAPPVPPAPQAPLANTHKPHTPPTKRPLSPASHHDERKAKRDKKPKRRRGHSRAGDGAEASTTASVTPHATAVTTGTAWSARNGTPHGERRKNGCRSDTLDPYAALVKRMPPAGAKKVKTTKELLEQIQSRGGRAAVSPRSPATPASPASPDVMLIEPDPCPIKVESPLRNGSSESAAASPKPVPPAPPPPPPPPPPPLPPLEDEREYAECTCGELADEHCPAAARRRVRPEHVRALHDAYLPGVNGTRAPAHPHQYAVRKPADPDRPDLFYSVVPLYKYSDYADDYCVKNMSRVPLSAHLPWTEFAPSPPPPPPPPSPPPLRPYPIDSIETKQERDPSEPDEDPDVEDGGSPSLLDDGPSDEAVEEKREYERPKIGPEMVGVPNLEASERLKAPLLSVEDESQFDDKKIKVKVEIEEKLEVAEEFKSEQREHRTVERTKEERETTDGRTLYALCERARTTVPYSYSQTAAAPVVTLPDDEVEVVPALEAALARAEDHTERDEFGRPGRAHTFTEWHECARLGDLLALPYVVID